MRAARVIEAVKTGISAASGGLAFVVAFPVVALASLVWLGLREANRHEGVQAAARRVGNIVLLLVSPFIAAGYMAALPMVGGYALISLVNKTVGKDAVMRQARRMVKKIGLALASPLTAIVGIDNKVGRALAAPFIGLAYIVFPVVVAVMFVSPGLRAWINPPAAA